MFILFLYRRKEQFVARLFNTVSSGLTQMNSLENFSQQIAKKPQFLTIKNILLTNQQIRLSRQRGRVGRQRGRVVKAPD